MMHGKTPLKFKKKVADFFEITFYVYFSIGSVVIKLIHIDRNTFFL